MGSNLGALTQPATSDTRSEPSGKKSAERLVGQFVSGFARGLETQPQRVLVEETLQKLSNEQQKFIKAQLGYTAVDDKRYGPKSAAGKLVSKDENKKDVQKEAVVDDPVKLGFDMHMVGDVVGRAAQAYPACMNTFNTCRFSRGGVSGTLVQLLSIAARNDFDTASVLHSKKRVGWRTVEKIRRSRAP